MKKVLIIADVSNLYYSNRPNKVDFEKVYHWCQGYGEIYRAIAYGAAMGAGADAFKSFLRHIGFEPKYKEPKIFVDQENPGKEYRKADWDVGMAMDIVRMLDNVDIVILCSADGDLAPCIEWIEFKGKQCIVLASGISFELKQTCYQWQEMGEDFNDETNNPTRDLAMRPGVPSDGPRPIST